MNYFILTEADSDRPMKLIVEAKMNLQQMKDALAKNRVVVKFIKIGNRRAPYEGANRVRYMYCTRNPDIIKSIGQGHKLPGPGSQGYKGPKEVIPVFDLVKKDWRSFDVRTVKRFQVRQLNMIDRIMRRNRYDRDFKRSIFRDPIPGKFVAKEGVEVQKPVFLHALEISPANGFKEFVNG